MLQKFKGLIQGISTRKFGDCRKNPQEFLGTLKLDKKDLVLAQQVHGNKIRVVGDEDKSQVIAGVDGLITCTPGVILGVRTADCLPILFYEPEADIIGVCHAGWKGVLAGLPQKMIDMIKIPEERMKFFKNNSELKKKLGDLSLTKVVIDDDIITVESDI